MLSPKIVEALKEFLRVAILAALVILIPAFAKAAETGVLDVNLAAVGFAAAGAVLRAVDKYLHESGISSPLDLKVLDFLSK